MNLTTTDNHTPEGKKSWQFKPNTYHHLELLTQGTGKFRASFWAKSDQEVTLIAKNIYRTGAESHHSEDIKVPISGDSQWHEYFVDYTVTAPYPGPRTSELLLTMWNENARFFLDDIELRRNSPDSAPVFTSPDPLLVRKLLINGDFESDTMRWQGAKTNSNISPQSITHRWNGDTLTKALLLSAQNNMGIAGSARQTFDATELAGKTIRISADAGFLSLDAATGAWSGILFTLEGADTVYTPSPSPFWLVPGTAPQFGTTRKISAIYHLPEGISELNLVIVAQGGTRTSKAIVDNITIEILPKQ